MKEIYYLCAVIFSFYKYQGTGNDFILIDNRKHFFPKNTYLIHKLCDRKFGIGADGLMLLENADNYLFRMVYYNADGNEGSMCGNGGRCIVAFAKKLNIIDNSGTFIAVDGEHHFEVIEDQVKLNMIDVQEIKEIKEKEFELFTGSPHYVVFTHDVSNLDVFNAGREIRYNSNYKVKGINVNFVEIGDTKISMRTYERGVEDETLSCGTGNVAVALALASTDNAYNDKIELNSLGGKLKVYFKKQGTTFSDIWLEGPAEFVFHGEMEIKEDIHD